MSTKQVKKVKTSATEKSVSYAYPTSPMAAKLGYGAAGRWYVDGLTRDFKCVDVFGSYATKEEAFEAADKIDLPFSRWSRTK